MDGVEEIGRRVPPGAVDGTPSFPYIKSPRYGEVPAPSTLGELLTYLESVSWRYAGLSGWRGQADIGWRLHSTAARRLIPLKETSTDFDFFGYWGTLEEVVRQYEKRLLDQARMAGHGFREGRRLTDLELLSVLQHYGAATRLLDFTRNVFVALWFACREHMDRHGLLMGIEGNNRGIWTEDDLDKTVPQLVDALKPEEGEFFYVWEPRHLFERMRVQQSLFVLGRAGDLPSGSAPFVLSPDDSSRYDEEGGGHLMLLAVPPCLKAEVVDKHRPRLKEFLGYDARALFPDIEGFSAFHAAGQDPEAMFLDL